MVEKIEERKLVAESEIRGKFRTDKSELKIPETHQTQNLKGKLTKSQLENLLKKSSKYKGDKIIEIFVNNVLFEADTPIFEFVNTKSIGVGEKALDIYYSFQQDEPKLTDSKKQDEWIKKIVKLGAEFVGVGLFNSEFSIYNARTALKSEVAVPLDGKKKKAKADEEIVSDFNLLNDFCPVISQDTDDGVKCLFAIAKRDPDYALVFKEVVARYDGKEVCYSNSLYVYNSDEDVSCLSSNRDENSIFAAGTVKGSVEIFKISNYEYLSEQKGSSEKPSKKRGKEYSHQFINPSNKLSKIDSAIECIDWIDSTLLMTGSLESIKIFNSTTFSLITQFNSNHHLTTSLSSLDSDVIASTHDNGSVKIWDLRSNTSLAASLNKAHKGYASNVIRGPGFNFISSGYDGEIKFWDRRNLEKSLHKFPASNKDKVFSILLSNSNRVLSGGASGFLDFYDI